MRLKMNGRCGAQGLSALPGTAAKGLAALSVAVLMCLGVVSGRAWADSVTRSVEPVAGGCKVTLAWEFSGKVESDLIIEEMYATGWSVASATVPFASLDATWLSGPVARFAVKPALLARPGSITFTVAAGATAGNASGTWMMYLDGSLKKGVVVGAAAKGLTALPGTYGDSSIDGGGSSAPQEMVVAISSFQLVSGGCELLYSLTGAGTLVIEGCKGLGQSWSELKRLAAVAGDGKVKLTTDEVGGCSFMRMKLLMEVK